VKKRILVFNNYYLPGYKAGGPIKTIDNIVRSFLGDYDFYIVSFDRDVGDKKPYKGERQMSWMAKDYYNVYYIPQKGIKCNRLFDVIKKVNPDLIYLNSFFDPYFVIRIIVMRRMGMITGIPIVMAPRGEFSDGAIKIKFFKKRIYVIIVKIFGLYGDINWQASSEKEKEDLNKRLKNIVSDERIFVAPDVVIPQRKINDKINDKNKGYLRICFLSRIHPMKNLDYVLNILKKVNGSVDFNIYGPIADVLYWKECEKIIKRIPSNINVNYCGSVSPEKVLEVMSMHDMFILPTRGENYGHVIVEALMAGLPVLISDNTKWDDIMECGSGWIVPLRYDEEYVRIINDCVMMDEKSWKNKRNNAYMYAYEKIRESGDVLANKKMFDAIMGG